MLAVFPGDSGSARVYEDQGNSLGYQRGEAAWTPVRQFTDRSGALHVRIEPVQGGYSGMPRTRGYEIRLPGRWPPARVTWQGVPVPYRADPAGRVAGSGFPVGAVPAEPGPAALPGWHYDGDRLTTIVALPASEVGAARELVVRFPAGRSEAVLDGVPGRLRRLYGAVTVLEALWPADWAPDALVALQQTGNRITLHPDSARVELERLHAELPGVLERLRHLKGDPKIIERALAHLGAP